MKLRKSWLILPFTFVLLLAAENSFFATQSSNLHPSQNIWGIAPKTTPGFPVPTDDSTWVKADSVPLPSIGSNDAYTGLKVYGDTIYLMWNRYNLPYRVLKLNRLNGSEISYFDAPSIKYAMGVVRFGDSVCVSCFYPSEGFDVYDANGTYVRSFSPPSGFRSRGLDWDGSKFWVANSQTNANTIYTMTATGTLLRNLTNTGPVTCYWFFDLTLDRMIPNRLWVNDQQSPYVTRYIAVDTLNNTYQVNATFTHPGSPTYYPEGIGFYGPEGRQGYVYTEGHASPWAWKMLVHTFTSSTDVGVAAIRNPLTVVDPNVNITPRAIIRNFGTSAQSNIPVYCWIDSAGTRIYNQNVTFPGPLAPNETALVSFPNWLVGPAGASYSIKMFTDLANDSNRTNDTARQTTYSFLVRDTLIAPWRQVIPTVDGYIQTGEWADALRWDISDVLNMQGSGARPPGSVFLYVKHDSNNVYWALDFVAKSTREDYDQFGCYLDENCSRTWATDSSEGNHWFVWLNQDTVIYRALIGPGNIPSAYWQRWLPGNGISRASTASGHLQFEAVVAKGTAKWNYTLNPEADTVGFYVYAASAPGTTMWGTWPTRMPGTNWNNAATYGTLIFSREQVAMDEGKTITRKEIKISNPLRMPLILRGVKEVSVYDATGKVVRNLEAKDWVLVWNESSLPKGVYFLKIKADNGSITTKAIIMR
jgi:hypothetical protein